MRYSNELSTSRSKGVFIANLEYKRKSHLGSATARIKSGLKKTLQESIDLISSASSLELMQSAAERPLPTYHLKQSVKDVYQQVGTDFARVSFKNLRGEQKSDVETMEAIWSRNMEQYVEDVVGNRISLITNTTEERFKTIVKQQIAIAQKEGWSIEKTAAAIKAKIGFDSTLRAVRIARTEVVSASNKGSLTGAQSTGLQLEKQWMATRTGNTRHSHQQANGQKVDINGRFRVEKFDAQGNKDGFDEMDHPGDPSGSAGNVINCRCTQVYVRKF
jgi:hypothetical protein